MVMSLAHLPMVHIFLSIFVLRAHFFFLNVDDCNIRDLVLTAKLLKKVF